MKIYGKLPSGKRLERILKSPNYKEGVFQNIVPTQMMAPDASMLKVSKEFFLKSKKATEPSMPLPSVKTNLKELHSDVPVVVWFGHSSYFLQVEGKNILVDPVFSNNASPVSFMVKAFKGSNVYRAEDMPELDLLILTHDHYDHLDYKTILKLKNKVKHIICAMGVGSHLEYWGISASKITELDWWESADTVSGLRLTATPARHFTGRGLTRAKTLWASFVLQSAHYKFFLGGDSGYGEHFKAIGDLYGPFDLALLESGQYNENWPFIHMMPEQTVQASIDLKANVLMPVHWAKFSLALHAWDEPIRRLLKRAGELKVRVTTPQIGEPVLLGKNHPDAPWWELGT